ncbi:MAG TPA: DUF2905 domain-containing protein [Myxococcales bacterium]|jgi:DUF2905 family protein|nr:DUF2905 domain-containing protein [Myxococcales bacterium]
MEGLGKLLLVVGTVLAAFGAALLIAGKMGLPRLPGDILIRRDNFTFYMPLGLMLLLSLVLTVVLNLVARR